MDINVSRKETRYLKQGAVQVLMSNVFDLYPEFDSTGLVIEDVDIITDTRTELLDRAMWAALKQYGLDPKNITDGNQYEECLLGEITYIALTAQIYANVMAVGTGVTVTFTTSISNGREYLVPTVMLTNAV